MLSVGRQYDLNNESIHCQACFWDGVQGQLKTGLFPINHSLHLYAYRCPDCGSFDLQIKGKLLSFRLRKIGDECDTQPLREDVLSEPHHHGNSEKRHSR